MTSFNPDIHVPGAWCCAKCGFTLLQSNLNAHDGSITARDEPGDKCPNDGALLWRVTWRQQAEEMGKRCEEAIARAVQAEGAEQVGWTAAIDAALAVIESRRRSGVLNSKEPRYAEQRGADHADALYFAYQDVAKLKGKHGQ